jgi:hypothetical protein
MFTEMLFLWSFQIKQKKNFQEFIFVHFEMEIFDFYFRWQRKVHQQVFTTYGWALFFFLRFFRLIACEISLEFPIFIVSLLVSAMFHAKISAKLLAARLRIVH